MNFLAHAYLSFGNPGILVGNMIADLVKGKQTDLYPQEIKQGIIIHRKIDAFTDSHTINLHALEIFRSSVGKYASPFLDVSYDHFLALDSVNEPLEGWKKFARNCYHQIETFNKFLPEKFCSMFLYMKSEDWLYNYRYDWLMEKSFERLKQRAVYLDNDAPVFENFKLHYNEIKYNYEQFFPELKRYVESLLSEDYIK